MISVVLPCFNEEDSIQKNIDSIKKELDKYGKDYEIIVVDDGSKDNSQEKLKNLDIKIVIHPHNIGYGAALKTGINNARFDTIVISDIDDSYPSKHISELLNIYFESSQSSSGYDMVVGARKGNAETNGLDHHLHPSNEAHKKAQDSKKYRQNLMKQQFH